MSPGLRTVLKLGTAQTVAWASSFYLPAMLGKPMAQALGVTLPTVYAVLSMALVVSALIGPWAGRFIDHHGGRPMLAASNLAFALGLGLLGLAQGAATLVLAWVVLGAAMGCGLYDTAFAALVRLHGRHARRPISGITLIAGFASTVGWPLSAWLEVQFGWRGACFAWAGLHLLLALPLNLALPQAPTAISPDPLPAGAGGAQAEASAPAAEPPPPLPGRATAPLLAAIFMLMSLVSTGVATHLPALLVAGGTTLAAAVAVGALMGPAQVAARLVELGLLRRLSPLRTARAAALAHPLSAALLLGLGPVAAVPFVVVHGLGNGLLTIVRGTLPLALFGNAGYGARQGWLTLPARMMGAAAPWLFGLALESLGASVLWLTAALALVASGLLQMLRLPPH